MPLHEIFSDMARLGLLGLTYDPSDGGQGGDHRSSVVLAEELGRADHGALAMATGTRRTWPHPPSLPRDPRAEREVPGPGVRASDGGTAGRSRVWCPRIHPGSR